MTFLVGDLTQAEYDRSNVKHIRSLSETQTIRDGEIIEFLGHTVRWNSAECVSEQVCQRWRAVGDPLCDAAVEAIFDEPHRDGVGKDLLQSLEECAAGGDPRAQSFLDCVLESPPPEILVSDIDVIEAQSFFLDYAIQIMQALLHYSLAAGFASPQIVRTLRAASYLLPPQNATTAKALYEPNEIDDRTFSRLLETFQFVLDVMGSIVSTPSIDDPKCIRPAQYLMPGGEGWKSVVRVRMLHAVARRRVRKRLQNHGVSNAAGVPISQEDMSATLASFSTVPLWALKRLGLSPQPTQVRAYLALWRHVGFYLGVSPDILTRYLKEPSTADKFLASIVLDLFSSDQGIDTTTLPTIPILRAVSNRPPRGAPLVYNIAVTRYLAGDELADHLGLAQTSFRTLLKLHWTLFTHKIPIWFGMYYPRRGWSEKRRAVMREGLPRSVRWSLGMRRTVFRPRTDIGDQPDAMGGELGEDVKEAEKVMPDFVGGKALARRWTEVLVEMAAVSLGFPLLIGGVVWLLIR